MIFKIITAFILCLLIFNDSYSEYLDIELSKQISQEDSTRIIKTRRESVIKYLKENNVWKNSYIALGLAIFPGAVAHGFGHFYAGHRKTSYFLFSLEILSIIVGPLGALAIQGSAEEAEEYENFLIFLFFASWAYDIIGAPLTCVNYNNKKIKEYWTVQPFINNSQFENKIGLKFSYHF